MKTLFVMRHAKSSWDNADLSDFERPLNERGLRTAPLMGKFMREQDLIPDLIIASTAKRAVQTAESVKKSAEFLCETRFEKRIYEAGISTLLYLLAEIDDKFSKVLIVGHNPSFENLVGILSGQFAAMPTATLAEISLDIKNWREISTNCGTLKKFIRPKEISDYK